MCCKASLRKGVANIKHGKKPNREQRKLLTKAKLNTQDWLVERDTPEKIVLVHKHFDSVTKTILKGETQW
jgi:hypothetical protein